MVPAASCHTESRRFRFRSCIMVSASDMFDHSAAVATVPPKKVRFAPLPPPCGEPPSFPTLASPLKMIPETLVPCGVPRSLALLAPPLPTLPPPETPLWMEAAKLPRHIIGLRSCGLLLCCDKNRTSGLLGLAGQLKQCVSVSVCACL